MIVSLDDACVFINGTSVTAPYRRQGALSQEATYIHKYSMAPSRHLTSALLYVLKQIFLHQPSTKKDVRGQRSKGQFLKRPPTQMTKEIR